MPTIDLNSDLGEGYGSYVTGDDLGLLDIVSSANVACGFHGGDAQIMADVVAAARDRGVSVGAHPGYQDLWGFGRRDIPHSAKEIEHLVAYQIGALTAIASLAGYSVDYVKPHGALGNLADGEATVADAVARAIKGVDPALGLLATALGELVPAGDRHGLRVYHEVFADRLYADNGLLLPRSMPGAVVTDADTAAQRSLAMLDAGAITTVGGRKLLTPIDTICVHGDTPHALAIARSLKAALLDNGFEITPFARRQQG